MHGDADLTIPFSHGQQLYSAAPNPKKHLWVNGASHTDLEDIAEKAYDDALQEFQKFLILHNPFSRLQSPGGLTHPLYNTFL
jgi:abhydrolase domain-containing protein 17